MADVWDGLEVKLDFRRNFDESVLVRWFELEEIVKSITYNPGGNALVWIYNSNGIYSTQFELWDLQSRTVLKWARKTLVCRSKMMIRQHKYATNSLLGTKSVAT